MPVGRLALLQTGRENAASPFGFRSTLIERRYNRRIFVSKFLVTRK